MKKINVIARLSCLFLLTVAQIETGYSTNGGIPPQKLTNKVKDPSARTELHNALKKLSKENIDAIQNIFSKSCSAVSITGQFSTRFVPDAVDAYNEFFQTKVTVASQIGHALEKQIDTLIHTQEVEEFVNFFNDNSDLADAITKDMLDSNNIQNLPPEKQQEISDQIGEYLKSHVKQHKQLKQQNLNQQNPLNSQQQQNVNNTISGISDLLGELLETEYFLAAGNHGQFEKIKELISFIDKSSDFSVQRRGYRDISMKLYKLYNVKSSLYKEKDIKEFIDEKEKLIESIQNIDFIYHKDNFKKFPFTKLAK